MFPFAFANSYKQQPTMPAAVTSGPPPTLMARYALTLHGHIKTAEQRTIIQQLQYGDWYTGH